MGSKREELVVFSILGTAPAGQMSLYLQCEDKRYCLMLYIKYEIYYVTLVFKKLAITNCIYVQDTNTCVLPNVFKTQKVNRLLS